MNLNASLSVLAGCLFGLTGCGGGSDSTTSSVTTPTSVGVLTDSAVGGVQYTTSSGYTGVTDANGNYNYNPGETVTFRIGAITLGTVAATGTITPIQLAGSDSTSANRIINLLVLLQSLDADNNPANGITINAATLTAATNAGSLDLAQAPAQFASTGNTTLTSVMSSGGLTSTTPVDPAIAKAHFKEEFFKQLKGAWTATTNDSVIFYRFNEAGKYIHGQVGPAKDGGTGGTEVGMIDWDPTSGVITVVPSSVTFDSNGQWGPAKSGDTVKMRFDGDKLILTDSALSTTFVRVASDAANPLVGTWVINEAGTTFPNFRTQTFSFFGNGRYLMADPLGDVEAVKQGAQPCGPGGIEYGNYTFNVASGDFSVTTRPLVDTNGCAGAWDDLNQIGAAFKVTFNADKSSFTAGQMTAFRVSK